MARKKRTPSRYEAIFRTNDDVLIFTALWLSHLLKGFCESKESLYYKTKPHEPIQCEHVNDVSMFHLLQVSAKFEERLAIRGSVNSLFYEMLLDIKKTVSDLMDRVSLLRRIIIEKREMFHLDDERATLEEEALAAKQHLYKNHIDFIALTDHKKAAPFNDIQCAIRQLIAFKENHNIIKLGLPSPHVNEICEFVSRGYHGLDVSAALYKATPGYLEPSMAFSLPDESVTTIWTCLLNVIYNAMQTKSSEPIAGTWTKYMTKKQFLDKVNAIENKLLSKGTLDLITIKKNEGKAFKQIGHQTFSFNLEHEDFAFLKPYINRILGLALQRDFF